MKFGHFISAALGALVGTLAWHTAPALAYLVNTGLVVMGTVGGVPVASSAGTIEAQNSPDAGISVYRTGTCALGDESFLAFWAKDGAGNPRKNMSISSQWKDCDSQNGYSWLRLNSTYRVNGVQHDDLQIQMFGGKGMTFCGSGGDPETGIRLQNSCTYQGDELHRYNDGIALKNWSPGAAAPAGYTRLRMSEGKLQVIFDNGAVKNVVLEP